MATWKKGTVGAEAAAKATAKRTTTRTRQYRFSMKKESENHIVVVLSTCPFSVEGDMDVTYDGEATHQPAFKWSELDGVEMEPEDEEEEEEFEGEHEDGDVVHLSVLGESEGRAWSVMTGASASHPAFNSVQRNPKPRPHQQDFLNHYVSREFASPTLLMWGMGSGKTLGVVYAALNDSRPETHVVVVCSNSLIGQWAGLLERSALGLGFKGAKGTEAAADRHVVVEIIGTTEFIRLCNETDVDAFLRDEVSLLVVDESQNFRSATGNMMAALECMHCPPRTLLLSGTPLCNDEEDLVGLIYSMAPVTGERPNLEREYPRDQVAEMSPEEVGRFLAGRVSVFDPREHAATANDYPVVETHCPKVTMSWAQTLLYLKHRSNTFELPLIVHGREEPIVLGIEHNAGNRYNIQLKKFSNAPFPDNPELCPKIVAMAYCMDRVGQQDGSHKGWPQVVHSSFIKTGIEGIATHTRTLRRMKPVRKLTKQETEQGLEPELGPAELCVECIIGKVSAAARTNLVKDYNKGKVDVLLISDAGSEGLDLLKSCAIHIMAPCENLAAENQAITRVIRFQSHKGIENPIVYVMRYVSVFPTQTEMDNATPDDRLLLLRSFADSFYDDVLEEFGVPSLRALIHAYTETPEEVNPTVNGLTDAIMAGLLILIRDRENGETIDEVMQANNDRKQEVLNAFLREIKENGIAMPLTAQWSATTNPRLVRAPAKTGAAAGGARETGWTTARLWKAIPWLGGSWTVYKANWPGMLTERVPALRDVSVSKKRACEIATGALETLLVRLNSGEVFEDLMETMHEIVLNTLSADLNGELAGSKYAPSEAKPLTKQGAKTKRPAKAPPQVKERVGERAGPKTRR